MILAMGVVVPASGCAGAREARRATGVFYGSSPSEARQFTGGHVFVVGGANSAGQAAVHLARYAASVTLVCRGASLADGMSQYLLDEIGGKENISVRQRPRWSTRRATTGSRA